MPRSASRRGGPGRSTASTRNRAPPTGRACRPSPGEVRASRVDTWHRTTPPASLVSRTAASTRSPISGVGHRNGFALTEHAVGHRGVVGGGIVVGGAEHRDPVRGELANECLEHALDAAHARREVVGDEQRAGARPRRRYPVRAMQPLTAPTDEIDALTEGRAAVDLSAYRKVRVQGSDAVRWLHDLVTTDVASLDPRTGAAVAAARSDRSHQGRPPRRPR